jgi:glutamyl-tRNA(Gln) amidotransferase subunit D
MLARSNVSIGDRIMVNTRDGEMSGTLMPRYESADKKHIVIKLDSGYNIGIKISKIESIYKVGLHPYNESSTKVPHIAVGGSLRSQLWNFMKQFPNWQNMPESNLRF